MITTGLIRRIRITAILIALTGGAWLLLAATNGGSDPWPEPREPITIPFADVHPYGVNFFLERYPDEWKRETAVEMATEAGMTWAKQHFVWAEIEPQPDAFEWAKYDDMVRLYEAHDMEVIARLDWGPPWVREDFVPGVNNPPDADNLDAYADFAGRIARRYRGRVRFYQIWNEPNLRTEWANQPVDPAAYAALLASAAEAIRAVDPNAVILSAPLAMTTEALELGGNLSDIDYLDALYAAGAAENFDILSSNAFGMDRPPSDPPDPDILNLRRVELQREVMEAHGDTDKAIWLNEYAWNAAPASMPARQLTWRRVSEETQAEWTVEGIEWAQEAWPWAGVFSIWYFQYFRPAPDRPEYYFAMVDLDFTPQRLYDAVRTATRDLHEAYPGEWGERSYPVEPQADARWVWAEGAIGRNALEAGDGGTRVALPFRGTGVAVRARRLDPAAPAMAATLDGAGIAVEPDGPAPGSGEWGWWQVASALSAESHRLELALPAGWQLDQFRVAAPGGLSATDQRPLLLGLITAILAGVLIRDLVAVWHRV